MKTRFVAVEGWTECDSGGVRFYEVEADTIEEAAEKAEPLGQWGNGDVTMRVFQVVAEVVVDAKAAERRESEARRRAWVASSLARAETMGEEIALIRESVEALQRQGSTTGAIAHGEEVIARKQKELDSLRAQLEIGRAHV